MSNTKIVSVSRIIHATPGEIFSVIADASRHADFDGSGTVRSARGEPEPLTLGSKFGMSMKQGLFPYPITNTVVEFEPDALIAWRHLGRHRWRYELEAIDDTSTKVTESFDWSTSPIGKVLELAGYPKKHVVNMEATLARLADIVEA